jgi:endonuclease/exonuclease/phosphatase (EEP) superfamily protein YafD
MSTGKIATSVSLLMLVFSGGSGYDKNITSKLPNAISAMSFNVLYNSEKINQSIDVIQQHSPDILCLRELTPEFSNQLLHRLGKLYPYQAMHPRQGTWGAGILSKYPLRNPEYFPVKPHQLPALQIEINIQSKSLLVSCLHLFPPVGKHLKNDGFVTTLQKNKKLRLQQAEYLVGKYKRWQGPILLLGDMNESRTDDAVKMFIANNYTHACDKAVKQQCGTSFPAHLPWVPAFFEIDHILGKGVRFLSIQVIRSGGSDHYPMKASFLLETTTSVSRQQ